MFPGEKELAGKLRILVNKQEDTKDEQAAVLYELGKLYLKAVVDQRNVEYFTKASALFNGALVRTSDKGLKVELKDKLTEVRHQSLNTFTEEPDIITPEQWEKRSLENKNVLNKLRENSKYACRNLESVMKRYDYDSYERQEMERILGVETKALSLLVKQEMSGFITMLWQQCLQDIKKEPPCSYSMLGLGSLARQEVTPYSDLEFAILVEKEGDHIQEYFKHLTYLFHLSVLDLGESPMAPMAILSLNYFMTPGGDWFYDTVTPSGFKLDGSMPWACKTPVGRPATSTKEALSLIQTPTEMAQLQRSDNVLGQAYHVADVMSQTVFLFGDTQLHEDYKQEVTKMIETDPDIYRQRGMDTWKRDSQKYLRNRGVSTFGFLNAKHGLYRFISNAVENLRLYLAPSYMANSSWNILEHLAEIGEISKKGAFNLTTALSIAFGYRLLTYNANMGQYETISLFHPNNDNKDDELLHLQRQQHQPLWKKRDLYNQHHTVIDALMTIIGDEKIDPYLVDLKNETFSKSTYTVEALSMTVEKINLHLNQNIKWAIKTEDIPEFPCGTSCMRYLAMYLEIMPQSIDTKLQRLDILLQSANYCKCTSVIKMHLGVHKLVLKQQYRNKPNLNPLGLVQHFNRDLKVRDRFFLILGMFAMASSFTDQAAIQTIITNAESFLDRSEKFPARDKLYINAMMVSFVYGLLYMYRLVDRTEDIVRLSKEWIQKIEKPKGSESVSPHLSRFYEELGKAYWKSPGKQEQAFRLWGKSLEIILTISSVEPLAVPALCDCVFTMVEKFQYTRRYTDATDLLSRIFIRDRELFHFTDAHVVEAFGSLAECYARLQNFDKSLELLEKTRQIVIGGEKVYELNDRKREAMASNLITAYLRLSKFEEIPKAAEFHSILCQSIPDQAVCIFEQKQFLFKQSLHLLILRGFRLSFYRQGMRFYEQGCKLDKTPKSTKNNGDSTLIDVYISYCKLSDIYKHTKNDFSANMLFVNSEKFLDMQVFSGELERLGKLCRIYLDYRRCACYVYVAVNHQQRQLLDTIHFLRLTQFLIGLYYPQCKLAYKWMDIAIEICHNAMKENHLTDADFKETYIAKLIGKRCALSEKNKQICNTLRKQLTTIIKQI